MRNKDELQSGVKKAIDDFYKQHSKNVKRKKEFWKHAGRPKWFKEWQARKANEKNY